MESLGTSQTEVAENSGVMCEMRSAPRQGLWESRLAPFFEKHFLLLCICLIGVASFRVISTYSALSLTSDEPIHLACGMEYVARHVYRIEAQHPPLSRGFQALGPYLAGVRPLGLPDKDDEGYAEIARSGNVGRTIFLMRLGNLPFFLLACLVVCSWSQHAFGKPISVVATGLFTMLPPALADAGLATTDTALGATVGIAFYVAILWVEVPTWRRTVLLGFCTALACLSKFTALGYLPAAASFALIAYLAVRWPGVHELWRQAKRRAIMIPLATVITLLVIWAGYWFSIGITKVPHMPISLRLPAPKFLDGIRAALAHNRLGHPAYLLGEFRTTGWWYYFPVALAVKIPLALLILFALGVFVCLKKRKDPAYLLPLAFSLGILIPAMRSHIDIGMRHIEPIYIALSIISAIGLRQMLQWRSTGAASFLTAGALLIWLAISGAVHHPDYLSYFNEFAFRGPENILVDSNYDWGQDFKLLAGRLHELGVTKFSLASSWQVKHDGELEAWYGLPTIKRANDFIPSPGWTVVSSTYDKSSKFFEYGSSAKEFWYDKAVPKERVGSLLLYYTPLAADTSAPPLAH